jgi:uncharacterized protein YqhQ
LIAAVSRFAVRFLVCVAEEAAEADEAEADDAEADEAEATVTIVAVVAVVAVDTVESRVCFCFVCSFIAVFISFSISG